MGRGKSDINVYKCKARWLNVGFATSEMPTPNQVTRARLPRAS